MGRWFTSYKRWIPTSQSSLLAPSVAKALLGLQVSLNYLDSNLFMYKSSLGLTLELLGLALDGSKSVIMFRELDYGTRKYI